MRFNRPLNCACTGDLSKCPNGVKYGKEYCQQPRRSAYTRRVLNLRMNQPISEARDSISFIREVIRREKRRDLYQNIRPLLALFGIQKYSRHVSRANFLFLPESERRDQIMTKKGSINNLAWLAEKRLMDQILWESDMRTKHEASLKIMAVGIDWILRPIVGDGLSVRNRILALEYSQNRQTV